MNKTENKPMVRFLIATVLIASLGLTACAPKSESPSNSGQDGFGYQPGIDDPADRELLEKVEFDGVISESTASITGTNGKTSLLFDKARMLLIVLMPLPSNVMMYMSPTPVGGNGEIIASTEFDEEGNLRIRVEIPIKYVLGGINLTENARLPSGEKLPPTPAGSGELPALRLEFPSHRLYLYIGVNAIGVYATLPHDIVPGWLPNITAKIRNKEKDIVGYLTYVSPKFGHSPGLFLGTRVPPKYAKFLEDYLGL